MIVGSSLNQKQKATLGNSWGCLLAGMKKLISKLIGLWQKCSMSFLCVRLLLKQGREIATQSAFFAAGWSDELYQSEDDVQEALELAGKSGVKSPGLVALPRGF